MRRYGESSEVEVIVNVSAQLKRIDPSCYIHCHRRAGILEDMATSPHRPYITDFAGKSDGMEGGF
jgi:hypothetical protein